MEDLYFSCKLNKNTQQIDFLWATLIASGYSNLTITVLTEDNQQLEIISCDPYISKDICSSKENYLKPGREYNIVIKLIHILPNHISQKTDNCSIKTSNKLICIKLLKKKH